MAEATSTPTIRLASVDDAPAMLEVIQAAFGSWPPLQIDVPAVEHLRWKMTPPGLNPPHDLLEIDGRLAGVRLHWQNRLQLHDLEFVAEAGADFAVHPDFQGRGLSRALSANIRRRRTAEPMPSISFLSNAPQIRHMNEPDYIQRPVFTWVRSLSLRSLAAVHHRERGIGGLARAAAVALRGLARRRTARPAGSRIEVLEGFDDRFDALWERARRRYEITFFRNRTYLEWRFRRPASGNSVILALLRGEELLGYAVVKRSWERGDLLDFLADPAEPEAEAALFDAAIEQLNELGANDVTCWLPAGHHVEPSLRRAGFAVVGTQTLLMGSPTNGETPPEALAILDDGSRSIHMTMSDFDYA